MDGDPHDSKDIELVSALETTDIPENSHIGIRTSVQKKQQETGGAGSHYAAGKLNV